MNFTDTSHTGELRDQRCKYILDKCVYLSADNTRACGNLRIYLNHYDWGLFHNADGQRVAIATRRVVNYPSGDCLTSHVETPHSQV